MTTTTGYNGLHREFSIPSVELPRIQSTSFTLRREVCSDFRPAASSLLQETQAALRDEGGLRLMEVVADCFVAICGGVAVGYGVYSVLKFATTL